MFKHKKHLFFDLDHTLWDFDANAHECLTEIYEKFGMSKIVPNFDFFFQTFSEVNRSLWTQLEQNLITHESIRKYRFQMALEKLEAIIDLKQSEDMNYELLQLLPYKRRLISGCEEILSKLHLKYELHILSNGYAEIQAKKLQNSGIDHFFKEVVTNDIAEFRKPDIGIFNYALRKTSAKPHESLMIGDSYLADIIGAKNAGWDTVHFQQEINTSENLSTLKITELKQILDYL